MKLTCRRTSGTLRATRSSHTDGPYAFSRRQDLAAIMTGLLLLSWSQQTAKELLDQSLCKGQDTPGRRRGNDYAL